MPALSPRQFQLDVDGAGLEERTYSGLRDEDVGDEHEFTGRLLHASNHEFRPGDIVMPPKHAPGVKQSFPGLSSSDHAYAYAESTDGQHTNHPPRWLGSHTYEVRPLTNDVSSDPNWVVEADAHPSEAVRSNKGFEVVAVEGRWTGHDGELKAQPSRRTQFQRASSQEVPEPRAQRQASYFQPELF